MKKLMIGLVAAALLPMSVAVQAKDLCLTDGFSFYKFKGVKSLKPAKSGKAVPLVGIAFAGNENAPASGTAVVQQNGAVNYGFMVYFSDIGVNFVVNVYGADATLAGTGSFVNDGTTTGSSYTLTAVDCKTLPTI